MAMTAAERGYTSISAQPAGNEEASNADSVSQAENAVPA